MNSTNTHLFQELAPELIMDALESLNYPCNGSVFALNSYENRVYQIGIEGKEQPLIAKFYRPDRWTNEQIQEEHDFCFELDAEEIPVITPIKDSQGLSIFEHHNFTFSLFHRTGGHAPELDHKSNLQIMARTLARMHNIGEHRLYKHRPTLDVDTFGHNCAQIISEQHIPFEHKSNYLSAINPILEIVQHKLNNCDLIRVHGDLHIGNILMREEELKLVDFDDSRLAPAIQDIWMLLSGEWAEQRIQLQKIAAAYNEFRTFPIHEVSMIESLRTLRMIQHSAWLAKRWDDPAFPPAFPWFNQHNYWVQHIQDLNCQLDALQRQDQQL